MAKEHHFIPCKITNPRDLQVRIGHVHLKVADLARSLEFYCGVVGFELTRRYGIQAEFVSATGYRHHIRLNTEESLGASPPASGTTALYHVAPLYLRRQGAFQRTLTKFQREPAY